MYETTFSSRMTRNFTDNKNGIRRTNLSCARTYTFFHMKITGKAGKNTYMDGDRRIL